MQFKKLAFASQSCKDVWLIWQNRSHYQIFLGNRLPLKWFVLFWNL